ncbi:hypothetical protein HYV84_04365 [Candidatus Woesearchaeota archaeon]|nr:hypothetical protein [Candidatus Woesearchaeota archaeon]
MENGDVRIIVPESLMRRYYSFHYEHPRLYLVGRKIWPFMDELLRWLYAGLLVILVIILYFYLIAPKKNSNVMILILGLMVIFLSLLLICLSSLFFLLSKMRGKIGDALLMSRMLCHRHLWDKKMNKISKMDIGTIIPLLAIKKACGENDEDWYNRLPKKVGSTEKTIKRLSEKYKINGTCILSPEGQFKEWTFAVKNRGSEDKNLGKILMVIWVDLLNFEFELLKNQSIPPFR